jgi:hypothetical protein
MKRSFCLVATLVTSITCNAQNLGAGQTLADGCKKERSVTKVNSKVSLEDFCTGAAQSDAGVIAVPAGGQTTLNTLSPIDNNGPGTIAAASKNSSLDTAEERRKAAGKSSYTKARDGEGFQLSQLLGNISIFANFYRVSGERKNELITTEQVALTVEDDETAPPDINVSSTDKAVGFSYGTINVNAGIDYRLNKNFLAGLVLAHNKRDTNQADETSFSKFKETQLSFLISYAADNGFYVDGIVGYGDGRQHYGREFSFTLSRDCRLLSACKKEVTRNPMVSASTDSQNRIFAASTGFEISIGQSSFTPFVRIESSTQTLDEYQEFAQLTSDEEYRDLEKFFTDAFLLHVQQHKIESRMATLGLDYNQHFSTDFGVVSSKISIASVYQLKDADPIQASFFLKEDLAFSTETPSMDDHYLNLGFSTTVTMPGGLMFYALTEKMLEHKQLDQWGVAVGVRKEL